MVETMIRIENLSKVYGTGEDAVTALSGVNLDINKGDIHGIIGMSGAGKSTLIRCINRLDTPTDGRILIDGEDILAMNEHELSALRKRVSMIFQHFNLLMQKNVSKNIRYPLELSNPLIKRKLFALGERRKARSAANARVRELLKIVDLEAKAKAYPSQLSGGQKQRVAIARALSLNPEVLLCDEATSALDPMTTQSILSLLQQINKTLGITIVIITHEMAVIRQICDRVTIIDNGRIVEEGAVDEVFTHTKSAAGRRLFGVVKEETGDELDGAIRIIFDGDERKEPLLSQFIIKSGIEVSIISADMNRIGGKSYGQMVLAPPKDPKQRQLLIDGLTDMDLTVREVHLS